MVRGLGVALKLGALALLRLNGLGVSDFRFGLVGFWALGGFRNWDFRAGFKLHVRAAHKYYDAMKAKYRRTQARYLRLFLPTHEFISKPNPKS